MGEQRVPGAATELVGTEAREVCPTLRSLVPLRRERVTWLFFLLFKLYSEVA